MMAVVLPPLHIDWLATGSTSGVGFTVIVNVTGVPAQLILLLYNGVTAIVATTGAIPVFNAVNKGSSPLPLAGSQMEVSLFTHMIPKNLPLKVMG